ncbi:protein rolling stone-like [Branchiostoma floridae x Branchiostoma japonicum]
MTCGQRMRSEFRLKSFGLTHNDRHVFTRTPWLSNQLPFVLYRAAVCLYQIIVYTTIRATDGKFRPKSLAFLTEWGYLLLTVHIVVSAGLCFGDYYISRSSREAAPDDTTENTAATGVLTTQTSLGQDSAQTLQLPWHYKLYWALYNVSFSWGICITILYWTLETPDLSVGSIFGHAINSVTIVIDVMVSGLPCRLLHFVYPLTFGVVYILFTVVYWATGGTGLDGQPYIYPYLDYGGNPVLAAIVAVLAAVVAMPVCHCIVFGLVIVRESLVRLFKKRSSRQRNHNVSLTAL